MPHRDYILYADLLQGYNDSDWEVSGPSMEVSDDERYIYVLEECSEGFRVLTWPGCPGFNALETACCAP